MKNIFLLLLIIFVGCGDTNYNKEAVIKPTFSIQKYCKELFSIDYPCQSFPLDTRLISNQLIDLNKIYFNKNDMSKFYGGDLESRILSIVIYNKDQDIYVFAVIARNYDDYLGGGAGQIIHLEGGKINQNNNKINHISSIDISGAYFGEGQYPQGVDSYTKKELRYEDLKGDFACYSHSIIDEKQRLVKKNICLDDSVPESEDLYKFDYNYGGFVPLEKK